MEHNSKQRLAWITAFCGASITALIGATVIIGWYTHNATMVQVLPIFVPMQFNTALGFVLLGLSLLLLCLKQNKIAATLGAIIFLLGVISLGEYIFNINIGVDQLFLQHYITVETSHIGRMAPNTAICFMIGGITSLLFTLLLRKGNTLIIMLMALIVMILGLIAFGGYIFQAPSNYGWGAMTRMAVHTSIAFAVWGLAMSIFASRRHNNTRARIFFPLIIFIVVSMLFTSIWLASEKEVRDNIHYLTNIQTTLFSNHLTKHFGQKVTILRNTASYWQTIGVTKMPTPLHHLNAGIAGAGVFSSLHRPKWTISKQTNKQIISNANSLLKPYRLHATQHTKLYIRGNYFYIFTTPHARRKNVDTIVGIYNVKKLIKNLLSDSEQTNYNIELKYGNKIIYFNGEADYTKTKRIAWSKTKQLNLGNSQFTLSVWPTTFLFKHLHSWASNFLLLIGLLTALLLAFLSHHIQSLRLNEATIRQADLDLKQSTNMLIQTEKMSTIGTFVAGIAHELNNPLTGMLNYVDFCIEHTDTNDKTYAVLNDTRTEIYRCIDTVTSLLSLAHKDIHEEFTEQNIQELINNPIKLLQYRLRSENITVKTVMQTKITTIPVMLAKIEHSLLNLLVNACDAMQTSARKEITITVSDDQENILIKIADSGKGMTADQLKNITEPFYTTKPSGFGTGLGTTIVDIIVKEHHGSATYQSQPNEGTTATIRLPLKQNNSNHEGTT